MHRARFALLVLLAGTLTACGGRGAQARDTVDPVYERTMRAVHAGDWSALEKELTKEARLTIERDLTRLARRLAHPQDGKQEREIARRRLGDEAETAIDAVVNGGLGAALRFFVRVEPRDPVPPRRGLKLEAFRAEILYALPSGVQRQVRFVRLTDGWYVSDLQL